MLPDDAIASKFVGVKKKMAYLCENDRLDELFITYMADLCYSKVRPVSKGFSMFKEIEGESMKNKTSGTDDHQGSKMSV